MRQEELNEISQAFLDAWIEFFGAPMLYIPFDSSTSNPHPIYNEYWKAIKRARVENKELGYGERTKDYNQKKYEEELRMLLIQKRITA